MKRFALATVSLLLGLVVFSAQNLYAQFADRGIITGVVTDTSGGAVPDAKVTVTNQNTGASTVVGTNGAGNYSTPPLTLGKYRDVPELLAEELRRLDEDDTYAAAAKRLVKLASR